MIDLQKYKIQTPTSSGGLDISKYQATPSVAAMPEQSLPSKIWQTLGNVSNKVSAAVGGTAAKFVGSAITAPADIVNQGLSLATNRPSQPIQWNIPGVGGSFQADFAKRDLAIRNKAEQQAPTYETLNKQAIGSASAQSTPAIVSPATGEFINNELRSLIEVPLAGFATYGQFTGLKQGLDLLRPNAVKLNTMINSSTGFNDAGSQNYYTQGANGVVPGQTVPQQIKDHIIDDIVEKIAAPPDSAINGFGYKDPAGLRTLLQENIGNKSYIDLNVLRSDLTSALKTVDLVSPAAVSPDLSDALRKTSPVLDKQDKIQTLLQSGKPGGATESGILPKMTRNPSLRDLEVAHDAAPFVTANTPTKNISSVTNEIGRIATEDVRPFLKANPRAFNPAEFNAKLRDIEPPMILKSDPTLETSYDLVRKSAMDVVAKHPKTMEGMWDARQEWDDVLEKNFGDALWNPSNKFHTAIKQGALDTRQAFNDFIVQTIGDNGAEFSNGMRTMNNLYIARQNLAENAYKLLGRNAFLRFFDAHPYIKAAGEIAAGATAAKIGYNLLTQ